MSEAEEILKNIVGSECVWKEMNSLTNTPIELVLKAMQSYAEHYHKSRVEAVTDQIIEDYVLEFIDKHGMKEGLCLSLENTVVAAGGVLNITDWIKNELLKNTDNGK